MKGNNIVEEAPPIAKPAQHKIPNLGMASLTLQNLGCVLSFCFWVHNFFPLKIVPVAARSLLAEWKKLSSGQRLA